MTPRDNFNTFSYMDSAPGKSLKVRFGYASASIAVLLLLLFNTGCPSGTARNPRLSKNLYFLGQDYFERAVKAKTAAEKDRFLEESLVQLRQSVKHDDKNYLARNLLGYLFLQRADQELGMSEVSQCLRGEDAKEIRANAAKLFTMAQDHFKKVVEIQPKCTNSWLGLTNTAMFFNRYENAIKYARNVINTLIEGGVESACSSPGDQAVAWANIGWAHFRMGDKIRASKNLRQAIFLAPKFYLAHYWMGRVHFAENRYEDALKEFDMTAREFGLPQAVHQYLGLTKLKLGRKDEARTAFMRCVQLAPKSCTAEECHRYLKLMRTPD